MLDGELNETGGLLNFLAPERAYHDRHEIFGVLCGQRCGNQLYVFIGTVCIGTVELTGTPDLEPALINDGVTDIDDFSNPGTPITPYDQVLFGAADPTQVRLVGGFNPADDVDGDGIQDLGDNCPFIDNPAQTNRGSFLDATDESDFLGDACQCAETTDDGAVLDSGAPTDFDQLFDFLLGKISNPIIAASIEERCSIAGTTECNLRDLVFLRKALDDAAPSVDLRCNAALAPPPLP